MRKIFYIVVASVFPVLASCTPYGDQGPKEAPNASSDNLVCNFTEPFFALEFDAGSKIVFYSGIDTYDDAAGAYGKREFAKNARIVLSPANAESRLGTKLELQDGDGQKILDLTVDFKGSDAMSDNVYPVTALQQGKYGPHETGCTTTTFQLVDEGANPDDADARRLIERLVSK